MDELIRILTSFSVAAEHFHCAVYSKKRTALNDLDVCFLSFLLFNITLPPPYIFAGNAPKSDENDTVLWHKVLMT